jgi:hypothetical protein
MRGIEEYTIDYVAFPTFRCGMLRGWMSREHEIAWKLWVDGEAGFYRFFDDNGRSRTGLDYLTASGDKFAQLSLMNWAIMPV